MLIDREKIFEFVRFCIVGTIAAGIHYGIYYLLQLYIDVNIAYTTGYLLSMVCNFFMTSYLTFHSSPSFKKLLGFGGSHLINYLIHIFLFNFFLYIGISRLLAPILVLAVAVPVNFLILRWMFKRKNR